MKIKSFITYGTLAVLTAFFISAGNAQSQNSAATPDQPGGSASTSSQTGEEDSAVKAAKSWLALVDNENYAESWKGTAPVFQAAVTQELWTNTMNGLRKPLGDLISRKLKSAKYMTQMPGAPDGEYVVMKFNTSFTNKKTAIETVTVGPKAGVQWKVSGYYMD
jgi:hypothetical protein